VTLQSGMPENLTVGGVDGRNGRASEFWRGVVDFHRYAAASIGAEIFVLIKEE
jgi:hypothetical protein